MLLVIVTVLAVARRQGPEQTESGRHRRLIISSDDAGMCPSVNLATIAALERGCVSSVSIMTCCPEFEDFAAFAVANPQYDYGVHLTLNCNLPNQPWGPVLPVTDVPSLVDAQGHFHSGPAEVKEHARLDEVERELRAQIRRAVRAGIRITHIDHHMFVLYSRPDLLDLYGRLAVEFRVPARLCRKPPLRQSSQDWLAAHRRDVQRLEQAGLPLLDAIESDNYSQEPSAKRAFHLQTLRDLSMGVTELVIHCAYLDGPGTSPPHVERRAADTRFFLSPEARQELTRLGIQCVDWGALRQAGSSINKVNQN